jgi:hypothetical protein
MYFSTEEEVHEDEAYDDNNPEDDLQSADLRAVLPGVAMLTAAAVL